MSCATWVVFSQRTESGCRVGAVVVLCDAFLLLDAERCHCAVIFCCFENQVALNSASCSCTLLMSTMRRYSLDLLNQCGETGEFPRGESPAARAVRPLFGRGGAGGDSLGQWDWGSENAGMKAICILYYDKMLLNQCSSSYLVSIQTGVLLDITID